MKIAVLDDWQKNAHEFADWSRVARDHQLDVYHDTISGSALLERLREYNILCAMRERTLLSAEVLDPIAKSKSHYYQWNAQCRD